MVFLSILADFCHQLLRDWMGEERLLLLLLLLWIVVVLVVPLVFFFFATMVWMEFWNNFPNENLELIIEVEEEEEEEGTTLREKHCRRRLLEGEEDVVAEVVA